MEENKIFIKLENVTKYYTSEGNVGLGIRNITVDFSLGEFVIITGASGSGKTTLLNVITGMDNYEEGTLFINGEDSSYFGIEEYEEYRRKYISFIFQNYNLIESFTVYQNIELALIAFGMNKKERHNKVLEIIRLVGLEKRIKNKVTKLSGGEKQRVAIARALASDAPIIACDEITGNLDQKNSMEIIALLKKVSAGKLVLLVTHDPEEAMKYATRVIVMHDSNIDKDYAIESNENDDLSSKEITFKESKKMSFWDTYKLGLKTIASTPKKFIFMLLFFLISAFTIMFVYASYNEVDSGSIDYNSGLFNNCYDERIVIKKKDSVSFSSEEIVNLNKIKNVTNVYTNNILLNSDIYFCTDDRYVEYGKVKSIKEIDSSDLTKGTLPKNKNELVICSSDRIFEDYIGNTIYVLPSKISYEILEYKIVGYAFCSEYQTWLCMDNSFFDDNYKQSIFNTFTISSENESNKFLGYYFPNYHYVIDNSLSDNSIKLAYYGEDEVNFNGDITFENTYKSINLKNINITIIEIKYDEESYKNNLMGKEGLEVNYLDKFLCYCNQKFLDEILDENVYEISIAADDKSNVKEIVDELIGLGYVVNPCMSESEYIMSSIDIFSFILKIFMAFYLILMFFGLSALMYIILKNIMKSEQKSFQVMRSLGIDSKNIQKQIFYQLLSMAFISIVFITILRIVLSNHNYGYLGMILSQLNLTRFLFIMLLIIVNSLILGYRYSKKLISLEIVAKEME